MCLRREGARPRKGRCLAGQGTAERPVQLERRGREKKQEARWQIWGWVSFVRLWALYLDEVGLRRKGSELRGTDLAGGDKRVQLGGCNDNPGEEGLWPGPGW